MVKWFSRTHVYDASWEHTTAAFWVKYPNEQAKHIRSVDTVARSFDPGRQILRQRRLMNLEVARFWDQVRGLSGV